MENAILGAAVVYVAIGALVGLIGGRLLEERGVGSHGDREIMGLILALLWPVFVAIYFVWQTGVLILGTPFVPNILTFTFKAVVAVLLTILLFTLTLMSFRYLFSKKPKPGLPKWARMPQGLLPVASVHRNA